MSEAAERILEHLAAVESANAGTLDEVAERMHRTVLADGLILTTGTGHSTAMVLETFYRAGGLACVRPITHPAFLPLEGGLASTGLERVEGLGRMLVEAAHPSSVDTAFVFSNSGINPVPVEMAFTLREAGSTVVAVSSVPHMSEASPRAGHKLDELADHVLDTMTPYGDAFWPVGGVATAPLSSVTGTFLWSLLLVRLAGLADEAGTDLPLWVSANVEGGDSRNRELVARYRPRVPML